MKKKQDSVIVKRNAALSRRSARDCVLDPKVGTFIKKIVIFGQKDEN